MKAMTLESCGRKGSALIPALLMLSALSVLVL